MMVGVVGKRVTKWSKKQPNSAAHESLHPRDHHAQPGSKTGAGSEGAARPALGHSNDTVRGELAMQSLSELTNEAVGISGEHIADYLCAYHFGWGRDWRGHDDGAQGRWTEGKPGKNKLGKLSKGGSPKSRHVLYKLSDGANGTGIDAVWRAEGHNHGKPYAIVEAKATRDEDAPKFLRKLNNTRLPRIVSTLGVNAIADPSELIEPLEEEGQAGSAASARTTSKGRAQKGAAPKGAANTTKKAPEPQNRVREVLVQMSREWIRANAAKAVGVSLERAVLSGYSRHLFFSPAYHPSGSPKAHMLAKHTGSAPDTHADHDAFHYDEAEVKRAVNKRKASLRVKHGNLPSLKEEDEQTIP